jgi:putative methyltransferase (TIGR04325 family)
MELAPILLFVYNRPEHTRQTLEALAANELASSSILYVMADGPKANAGQQVLDNIYKTRTIFNSALPFKEVIFNVSDVNLGLSASIIKGVDQILKIHGTAIILEDDIVTGKGFLKYMNEALNLYRHNEEVISISGYNYPMTTKGLKETFFIKGADCWGWATWSRGWQLFEQDAKKLYAELVKRNQTGEFDLEGVYPYTQMLKDHISGKVNSWAIRWHASAFLKNKLTLYPRISLVKNIGLDGSGTHGTLEHPENYFTDYCVVKEVPITEDKAGREKIKKYYRALTANTSISTKQFIKKVLKKVLPPVVTDILRKKNHGQNEGPACMWSGSYNSWKEAEQQTSGYNKDIILKKVFDAISKVYSGEAVYERDSVLFDKIQYSWAVLACLQKIALVNNGNVGVLDFGGSLGSSYLQNRSFLKNVQNLKWHIVEQQHFVECGKKNFESDQLRFHYSIEDALKNSINCLYLSSVLQYLQNPDEWIDIFLEKNIPYIIVDRTSFVDDGLDRLTVQTVPESIYKASYPCWFFIEHEFVKRFKAKYDLIADFESYADMPAVLEDGKKIYWKGFFFKRK